MKIKISVQFCTVLIMAHYSDADTSATGDTRLRSWRNSTPKYEFQREWSNKMVPNEYDIIVPNLNQNSNPPWGGVGLATRNHASLSG